MNPAELGYFERRPGSGIWYKPGSENTYEPRVCENSESPLPGGEFMGQRNGNQRFHSRACHAATRKGQRLAADPSYGVRHERVRQARGNASQFPCVDGCGRQAYDWSQLHGTDGTEPEQYVPRCRSCHKAYDGAARGEANGQARLTDARVRGIRASVDEDGNPPPARELAASTE